jgi:hypothetical protein
MNALNDKESGDLRGLSGFDRLILTLEHWRLLVSGPIVAFLVAYGVCFVWQQSYTSSAILAIPVAPGQTAQLTQTPAQAAAMMVSPLVLDPILVSLNLYEGRTLEKARKRLAEKIRSSVGKDNLLRLEVTANSPELAQKMSNLIIETWLKTTAPGAHERADLEKKLENAKKSLDAVNHLLKKLTEEGSVVLNKPLTRGEAGSSLVAVGELQARYLAEVLAIPRTLEGLSLDVVAQMPTLPVEPSAPRKELIAGMTALISFFALLVWIFVRRSWQLAAEVPAKAAQQSRLLAALGMGGRSS